MSGCDGPLGERLLRAALAEASISVEEGGEGSLLIDADPKAVGGAALRGGVALAELRPATDGSSLEQLFFQLTAGVQSDHDSDSNRKLQEANR